MTWNTLTNLSTGQVVTETHMDNIRENIEHLGAMLFGANALSALTAGSQLLFVTGTYTGDGAATKTISGLGFTPRRVDVFKQSNTNPLLAVKFNTESTKAWLYYAPSGVYADDFIVSLGSGQFVVGDGTGSGITPHLNENTVNYAYIAFR
jgi:hypothetical protein